MKSKKKSLFKLLFRMVQVSLTVLIFFQICACTHTNEVSCHEIMSEAMESEVNLPAGTLYSLSAGEGEKGYMSESFLYAMYGDVDTSLWLDASIYVSSRLYPCEIAVIQCNSPTAAEDMAKLFCKRLTILKNAWDNSEKEYKYSSEVLIVGNFVAMVLSSDAQNTKRIILSML